FDEPGWKRSRVDRFARSFESTPDSYIDCLLELVCAGFLECHSILERQIWNPLGKTANQRARFIYRSRRSNNSTGIGDTQQQLGAARWWYVRLSPQRKIESVRSLGS